VLKEFAKLIQNFTVWDLALLYSFDKLCSRVYFLDNNHKLRHPKLSDVGWSPMWLLARHNKKYIPPTRTLINENKIHHSMLQWEQKMKWRYILKDEDENTRLRCLSRGFRRNTPLCTRVVPPVLSSWLGHIREHVNAYTQRKIGIMVCETMLTLRC